MPSCLAFLLLVPVCMLIFSCGSAFAVNEEEYLAFQFGDASTNCITPASGLDCRNYGELLGIPEARKLFAGYMGAAPEDTIVVGSASLTFMYDSMARAMEVFCIAAKLAATERRLAQE